MNNELYHHGINGQKWGVRNGPPYPLGENDHSAREKKANWKLSLSNTNGSSGGSNTNDIQRDLCVDNKTAERLKTAAKILGLAAGSAACMVALGYLAENPDTVSKIIESGKNVVDSGKQMLSKGFNESKSRYTFNLDQINSAKTTMDRDPIGVFARNYRLGELDSSQIQNAINNPQLLDRDLDNVINDVTCALRTNSSPRRLSCWSGSNAYYMEVLTGGKFGSRSYGNLVNFNDFGKLYTKTPKIFDLHGESASDFVGKWGGAKEARATVQDTFNLVHNIFKNVSSSNNLAPDGKTTVGFINAAYNNCTCTHQWNFEVHNLSKADSMGGSVLKELFMADSYTGSRYKVADFYNDGKVGLFSGFKELNNELYHYNADSIRFYAPSLDSVNASTMSQVLIGNASSIKHIMRRITVDGGYLMHYGVIGMKWGVRRYRNSGGSYTKKGVSNWDKSYERYSKAKSEHTENKKLYKEGKISKQDRNISRSSLKGAKKQLNKDYKQLHRDKMGDKGKELYRSGKTITGSARNLKIAGLIASGTGTAAYLLSQSGNQKAATYTAAAGLGLEAVNAIFAAKNEIEARYLRAYYSHGRS